VQGLEDAVSLGIGVSRQAVISQLVAAADQAKLMMEPSSIISAMKNIAQICGYYRREEVKSAVGEDDGGLMDQLRGMSDQELMRLVEAGA
jgi:hypothetical protein